MSRLDITLQERHEAEIRTLLHRTNGHEAAAYVLFGMGRVALDRGIGAPGFGSHPTG